MEPCSQRESETLRHAFKIRLNEAGSAQQNSDEMYLASVAQVGNAPIGFTTHILGRHSLCNFGMPYIFAIRMSVLEAISKGVGYPIPTAQVQADHHLHS